MTTPSIVTCACGCGTTFPYDPSHPTKKYLNREHLTKRTARRSPLEVAQAKLEVATGTVKDLRATVARAEKREKELAAANDELRQVIERYSFIKAEDQRVPTWMAKPRQYKEHHATAVLMLSDLHLDEVVDLEDMDGVNEYNRAIAEERLERIVHAVVTLLRDYVAGVKLDGLLVTMLGDIITGVIHEELARTNEEPVPETIRHWVPLLCAALVYLADELGVPIHVPVVDGNHDRTMKKTPSKQRMKSSYAWIVYNWMADHLRDDPRITFGITTSPEQLVTVYDTTFLLNHGDQFRSAGGVGGLYPSMLKWLLRKHTFYSEVKRDFDYALIGHWHQPLWGQDFVVNGSLKGYDEYAKHGGFQFNEPSQQLFIVTPERSITQRIEVFAS